MKLLKFKFLILPIALGSSFGCSKAGLQGTNIASSFTGVTSIEAVSPTTVQIGWTLQARFNEYRVYRKGLTSPQKKETFAFTQINQLQPETTYEFSVTGVDSVTNEEEGYGSFVQVKTLANFSGLASNAASSKSNGSVEINWVKNGDNVTYKVFAKKENETWNLTTPIATVVGKSSVNVTSLTTGNKYCFWVLANYGDGTMEPVNQAEAYINSKAPCVLVQSLLANLPAVKVQRTFVGSFPWFWTEGGDSSYTTEVYYRLNDVRLGVVTGNDYFRSIVPVSVGPNDLYAKVTSSTGGVSLIDVIAEGQKTTPTTKPVFKNLTGAGATTPLTPRLAGGGKGIQELGTSSVVGDFNCDGLKDLAVTAPGATPFASGERLEAVGAVVVYYSYTPAPSITNPSPVPVLKTDLAPSVDASFPDPQLIYYTNVSSGSRFGTDVRVGNINGDCFSRYTTNASDTKANRAGRCDDLYNVNTIFVSPISTKLDKIKRTHSCDDLVVLSGDNNFYVLYGDPVKGLVTGAGGNSTGINEVTCDQSSYKCRPVRHSITNSTSLQAITAGDFNNDGYDDIAVSAQLNTTPAKRIVKVLKGSLAGLVPDSFPIAQKHMPIDFTVLGDSNTWDGDTDGNTDMAMVYPYAAETVYTGNSNLTVNDNVGFALGTAYNSRFCMKSVTWTGFRDLSENTSSVRQIGYDFTKCDDLIIGAPNRSSGRGSIFSCQGLFAGGTGSIITGWSCRESYPDAGGSGLDMTVLGYGSTILGVENQNGYPLVNVFTSPNAYPNITGSLFVGAPNSTVLGQTQAGAVFGYYMTPQLANLATDPVTGYGISTVLSVGDGATGHIIQANNTVPCDSQNNNRDISGNFALCKNQVLYTSPSESNVKFGSALGSIADTESIQRGLPSLAISAPSRNVVSSDGQRTIIESGVVYLYKADVSALGYEGTTRIDTPQATNNVADNCVSNCTWYSGGVNPSGPSLIYVKDLTQRSKLGLGSPAGADFDGDGAGDFVTGAPFLSTPSYNNGAAFVFYSKGSFPASISTPSKTLNPNISKELNYKFERAKVIGDINGDGYDDVAAQIKLAGKVEFFIYYGSASGLKTSPLPSRIPVNALDPQLVVVDNDTSFGREFYAIGSINGDPYADIFVTGSNGSYIYYGSTSGLVSANQPSLSPVGQNPLRFAISGTNVVTLHNSVTPGNTISKSPQNFSLNVYGYDPANKAVTYGDYNGDGFGDFAVATTTSPALTVTTPNGIDLSANNQGRVWVFYGSAMGPQVNRSSGTIRFSGGDVEAGNPCTTANVCKVQVLASPSSATTSQFGWSLTTIPSLDSASGDKRDELVVSDPFAGASLGHIYMFKGTNLGLANTASQTLRAYTATTAGYFFGYSLASVGDINGDGYADMAVTAFGAGGNGNTDLHILYGGLFGAAPGFLGPANLSSLDLYPATRLGKNKIFPASPLPQQLESPIGFTTSHFGVSVAGIRDINSDGFSDIIVAAPNKDYDLDVIKAKAGAFVIYYGSSKGLLIGEPAAPTDPASTNGVAYAPTTTPQCFGGSTPRCEPAIIYLPDSAESENTYLSTTPTGDLNGDGIPDVIIGSPGRVHPTGQAFATGVVYVL